MADFLVNYNLQFESSVVEIGDQIEKLARQTSAWESQRLVQLQDRIRLQAKLRVQDANYPLKSIQNKLRQPFLIVWTKSNYEYSKWMS